jgi:hydrogenase nickel incorporation protein HypB
MCQSCGCGDTGVAALDIHDKVLAANDCMALHNRGHFARRGILALNLMGSPGAGKTAIVEATSSALKGRARLGAVSGDLATDRDARRLRQAGVPALTITTGSACHLDAAMVHRALDSFRSAALDIFVIENVGNLVCPAIYDLGQAANVVALSVTEGEDKPLKYPPIFRAADLVLLTKIDLLPHLSGLSVAAFEESLSHVMPEPRIIPISARTGEGISDWIDWITDRLAASSAVPSPQGEQQT